MGNAESRAHNRGGGENKLSLPPESISVREIAEDCQKIAARWPEGSLSLAVLIGEKGVATEYLVGGPATAQIFVRMSQTADLDDRYVAVSASSLPALISKAPALSSVGYLLICPDIQEIPLVVFLVVLTRARARLLEMLAQSN